MAMVKQIMLGQIELSNYLLPEKERVNIWQQSKWLISKCDPCPNTREPSHSPLKIIQKASHVLNTNRIEILLSWGEWGAL